jgi:hypothetical protein
MRHRIPVIVVLLAAVTLAVMVVPSYAAMSMIRGTIYWYDQYGNLHPLAWAQVVATSETDSSTVASSTTDGTYIMWVAPGTYTLTVSMDPGFISQSHMVTVSPGGVTSVDFQLEPSGKPIPELLPSLQPVMLVVAALAAVMAIRRQRRTSPVVS